MSQTGVQLTIFLRERKNIEHLKPAEWVIQLAKQMKLEGASMFQPIQSFGENKHMHEAGFFELSGQMNPMMIFITRKEQATALIEAIKKQNVSFFYSICDAEFEYC